MFGEISFSTLNTGSQLSNIPKFGVHKNNTTGLLFLLLIEKTILS
jgi:hypothetical protein